MTDESKLKMVRESLEALVEAVGNARLRDLSPQIVDAYFKARGSLDGLNFVENLRTKRE